ncbi:von Willebrand factor type A [Candidatus Sulfopaludibacter sp. SbA3]|nr:von Willebrand factor type A [Candidatus Sulfopaludibacter sp. SbA3]
MSKRPGGELASRPLHFFWICDCSGSMQTDGKVQALNNAIKETVPHMQKSADENPNAQVFVRVLTFSDGAQWHVPEPTPVEQFRWSDLSAGGMTDMGKALVLLAQQLRIPPMTDRALPPVLVLISDGQPTDDFDAGLKTLMDVPWAKRAVRIAIAIGQDADRGPLHNFIGNPEVPVLEANNAETLVNYIRWASTAVLRAASSPASQSRGLASGGVVPIPAPPVTGTPVPDVW